MWSVILVEDEPKVRNGLKTVIPWEDYGFSILGAFADGQEALDYLKVNEVDLVVTDIKMPRMNGVELIRALRDSEKDVHVLILSGYDDVEYLKKAIELNVDSYMQKPLNVDELRSHIVTIARELESERQATRLVYEGKDALLNNLLHRLVQNEVSSPELRQKLIFLEFDDFLSWDEYSLGVVCLQDPATGQRSEGDATSFQAFAEALRSQSRQSGAVLFIDRERVPVVIARSERSIREIVKAVDPRVSKLTDRTLVCFGGVTVADLLELHHAYRTAYEHMFKSRLPSSVAIYISYADAAGLAAANHATEIPIREIDEALVRCDSGALRRILDAAIDDDQDLGVVSRRYFSTIMYIVSALQKRSNRTQSLFEELDISPNDFTAFSSRRSFREYSESICERIDQEVFKSAVFTGNPVVDRLIRYVRERYSEGISLKGFSFEEDMNAVYLGQLFRQTMGQKFTEYLKDVRVQRACDLLEQTPMKIADIALTVGFLDAHYFLKVFQERKGCTPSKYREMNQI